MDANFILVLFSACLLYYITIITIFWVLRWFFKLKSFKSLTGQLKAGVDFRDALMTTYTMRPVKIELTDYLNSYIGYLVDKKETKFIEVVNVYRNKSAEYDKLEFKNLPPGILPLMLDIENAAGKKEKEAITKGLILLATVIAEKNKKHWNDKRERVISWGIACVSVVISLYSTEIKCFISNLFCN